MCQLSFLDAHFPAHHPQPKQGDRGLVAQNMGLDTRVDLHLRGDMVVIGLSKDMTYIGPAHRHALYHHAALDRSLRDHHQGHHLEDEPPSDVDVEVQVTAATAVAVTGVRV